MNKDIHEIATELNKDIIERVFFEINGLTSCNLDDVGIDFGVKINFVDFTSDEDKIIGEMKATIFYGSSASEIFEQIDAHTLEYSRIAGEHFDDELDDYVCFWEEYEYEKFIVIQTIEIDENYRGYGITNLLIHWISSMFNAPMLLEAYPLQYSKKLNQGKIPKTGFATAQRKVINAYLKCGFKRTNPKSIILFHEPNYEQR